MVIHPWARPAFALLALLALAQRAVAATAVVDQGALLNHDRATKQPLPRRPQPASGRFARLILDETLGKQAKELAPGDHFRIRPLPKGGHDAYSFRFTAKDVTLLLRRADDEDGGDARLIVSRADGSSVCAVGSHYCRIGSRSGQALVNIYTVVVVNTGDVTGFFVIDVGPTDFNGFESLKETGDSSQAKQGLGPPRDRPIRSK